MHVVVRAGADPAIQEGVLKIHDVLQPLGSDQQIQAISSIVQAIGISNHDVLIPLDFLKLSI